MATDEPDEPLGEDEKEALRQDLVDVQVLRSVLGPKGLKGTVFYCADCEQDHYLTWELLAGNLRELLDAGEPPVHEPAFDPDPDQYVTWDYARGFLDGYEAFELEELEERTRRLADELEKRGWARDEIKGLMASADLDLPAPDDPVSTETRRPPDRS